MKILQITNKSGVIHIEFEEGQQGKKNMMVKINRFLTQELKARKAVVQKAADRIYDIPEVNDRWNDLMIDISYINYLINKITDVTTIDGYNDLHDVEVKPFMVDTK